MSSTPQTLQGSTSRVGRSLTVCALCCVAAGMMPLGRRVLKPPPNPLSVLEGTEGDSMTSWGTPTLASVPGIPDAMRAQVKRPLFVVRNLCPLSSSATSGLDKAFRLMLVKAGHQQCTWQMHDCNFIQSRICRGSVGTVGWNRPALLSARVLAGHLMNCPGFSVRPSQLFEMGKSSLPNKPPCVPDSMREGLSAYVFIALHSSLVTVCTSPC